MQGKTTVPLTNVRPTHLTLATFRCDVISTAVRFSMITVWMIPKTTHRPSVMKPDGNWIKNVPPTSFGSSKTFALNALQPGQFPSAATQITMRMGGI